MSKSLRLIFKKVNKNQLLSDINCRLMSFLCYLIFKKNLLIVTINRVLIIIKNLLLQSSKLNYYKHNSKDY